MKRGTTPDNIIDDQREHKFRKTNTEIPTHCEETKESDEHSLSMPMLSLMRFLRHKHNAMENGLTGTPQTTSNLRLPTELAKPENIKIRETILKICGDENGPLVIPPIIDHWTTSSNFKKIIESGAFYGSALLTTKGIAYTKNVLHNADIKNLDGNVICFCPGGFVDSKATLGYDKMRIRIDLRKLNKTGKYNSFFKITDLECEPYFVKMQVTPSLSISFGHDLAFAFGILFEFNEHQLLIPLSKNELVFYGDLAGINRFCLLLPFIALDKADKNITSLIYEHLRNLPEDELKKVLICLSQNMTMYSEYNFHAKLPLTPKLIYDVHHVSSNTTYSLHSLSTEDYDAKLKELANYLHSDDESRATIIAQVFGSTDKQFRASDIKNEVLLSALKFLPGMINRTPLVLGTSLQTLPKEISLIKENNKLYDVNKSNVYHINITKIPNNIFENGYADVRIGNRSVPKVSYNDSNHANVSTMIEKDTAFNSLKENWCGIIPTFLKLSQPELADCPQAELEWFYKTGGGKKFPSQ
ncbi:MAG: hypothetical protein JSS07_11740 [Proteobacteria bacterium]|nr:hypothetical protein [Pseudomonadota bacterium]